ncbi:uncharacterized protein batf2 [Chaetodon trifascialis]|uniref:uncharacterized protein batf2 n=1 Tax=Chaetodon trifascialis TaxID=109706 RepID=UPI0039952EE5
MSPLFMDTVYEANSPDSLSNEESHSTTAGSEREGEGQPTGKRGTKRQEKNRDAARRSRRKQTQRADELHEELQSLERSNSALQKEIASLKRDLLRYTTALDRHEPNCCLHGTASSSSSSSTTRLSLSPSVDCQSGSSPPVVPPQASASTQAAASSVSTSLTSSLGLQNLECVESPHLSSSTAAPTTTTLASPTNSSSKLFTSSSSMTVPFSVPAPHSLFYNELPSLITSRPTNVRPLCTSLDSNPVPSGSFTAAARPQSRQDTVHEGSSLSADACFSTLRPGALDSFLMKQPSFLTASSNVVPLNSHVVAENTGPVAQSSPMNAPQLHPGHFRGNPVNSSSPRSLLLSGPTLQSLSVFPQTSPEASSAPAFALKPSYSPHMLPSSVSLLSMLTVPSPLNEPQTTSSSFNGPLSQPLPSPPPLADPSRDLSLSELLEVNDWILQ